MGGAPTIEGGMTKAEQEQLLVGRALRCCRLFIQG